MAMAIFFAVVGMLSYIIYCIFGLIVLPSQSGFEALYNLAPSCLFIDAYLLVGAVGVMVALGLVFLVLEQRKLTARLWWCCAVVVLLASIGAGLLITNYAISLSEIDSAFIFDPEQAVWDTLKEYWDGLGPDFISYLEYDRHCQGFSQCGPSLYASYCWYVGFNMAIGVIASYACAMGTLCTWIYLGWAATEL